MANIGFTDKQLHVYDRFNALRLAYQAKHGRTYAPGFLTKLMDAWEYSENVEYDSIIHAYIDLPSAPKEAEVNDLWYLNPQPGQKGLNEHMEERRKSFDEKLRKIKERNNIEAQDSPVIIKQSDGALYLQSATMATANFGMTHDRSEAMVFDSSDQAKAFLRQAGREVGDWILEPVNQ